MKRNRIKIRDREDRIAVDIEATRRLYAAIARPTSETCPCVECRGFVANRGRAFPEAFLALLRRLSVDWTNEGELWAVAGPSDFYVTGQFDFIGEVHTAPREVTLGVKKTFDYVFKNVAAGRSIAAANELRLGSLASVRFGVLLPVAVHPPEHLFDLIGHWQFQTVTASVSR
jgi:hypothetical protein